MGNTLQQSKIIVRVGAGLGNQLFRYAAALRLSQQYGREIRFDLTDFLLHRDRKYQLGYFAGPAAVRHWNYGASALYLAGWLMRLASVGTVHRAILRVLRLSRFEESSAWSADPHILEPPRTVQHLDWYLDGYYQNLACLPEEELVRGRLRMMHPFKTQRARELFDLLERSNAVSVHVRRTDYTVEHRADCLTEDFYRRATDWVRKGQPAVRWVIFSDAPAWCRSVFGFLDDPLYVEGNEPWEDLRLMTACRHHIIANSTFSWWGAYLKQDRSGLTIAPEYWLRGVRTASCLLKPGWLALSNKG